MLSLPALLAGCVLHREPAATFRPAAGALAGEAPGPAFAGDGPLLDLASSDDPLAESVRSLGAALGPEGGLLADAETNSIVYLMPPDGPALILPAWTVTEDEDGVPGPRSMPHVFKIHVFAAGADHAPVASVDEPGHRPFRISGLREALAAADFQAQFLLEMPEQRPPRGLVLHLISLGGSRAEERVRREFRRRGFATLIPVGMTVDVYPELRDSDGESMLDRRRELAATPQGAADLIAGQFGFSFAAWAAANRAAVDFVSARVPGLADVPVVITGYSLGTLASPATAALLGDRVGAIVLVGGAADLPRLMLRSTALRGDWPERDLLRSLPQAERDEVLDAARDALAVDPYRLTPGLRGRPVLMVHARRDRIVPSDLGDLLWERLGRPERWSIPGGHLQLFLRLGSMRGRIVDWVEAALAGEAAG